VATHIDSAFAPRAKNLARRKEGITGVSEFPDVREPPVLRPTPDRATLRATAVQRLAGERRSTPALTGLAVAGTRAEVALAAAEQGASIGQIARALAFHAEPIAIPPLAPHAFARPFEELRDASDTWQSVHGKRPRVFLAAFGSVAHHTARAAYAKNFFEAGGFEIVGGDGLRDAGAAAQAFARSGAAIAVICSSDKLYPELVPDAACKLKAAGARTVVLAGNPGANEAAWRAAGVDRFIFVKCDVLAALTEMLHDEGVV
jgi:methylmalonyl-CoA mutase